MLQRPQTCFRATVRKYCFHAHDSPLVVLYYSIFTTVATVPTLLFSNLHMDAFLNVHGLSTSDVAAAHVFYSVWNTVNDVFAGGCSDFLMARFKLRRIAYLKILTILWVLSSALPFLVVKDNLLASTFYLHHDGPGVGEDDGAGGGAAWAWAWWGRGSGSGTRRVGGGPRRIEEEAAAASAVDGGPDVGRGSATGAVPPAAPRHGISESEATPVEPAAGPYSAVLLYLVTLFLYDGCASFAIIARNIVSNEIAQSEAERLSLQRWNSIFGVSEFLFVSVGVVLYQWQSTAKADASASNSASFQLYFVLLVAFCVWLTGFVAKRLEQHSTVARSAPTTPANLKRKSMVNVGVSDFTGGEIEMMTPMDLMRTEEALDDLEMESFLGAAKRGPDETAASSSSGAEARVVGQATLTGREGETTEGAFFSTGSKVVSLTPGRTINNRTDGRDDQASRPEPLAASVPQPLTDLPDTKSFLFSLTKNFWLFASVYATVEMQSIFSSQFLVLGLSRVFPSERGHVLAAYGLVGGVAGGLRFAFTWVAARVGVYRIVQLTFYLKIAALLAFRFLVVPLLAVETALLLLPSGEDSVTHAHHLPAPTSSPTPSAMLDPSSSLDPEVSIRAVYSSPQTPAATADPRVPLPTGRPSAPLIFPEEQHLQAPASNSTSYHDLSQFSVFLVLSVVVVHEACVLLEMGYSNILLNNLIDEYAVERNSNQVPSGYFFSALAACVKPLNSVGPVLGAYWMQSLSHERQHPVGAEERDKYNNSATVLILYFQFCVAVAQSLLWSRFTLHGARLRAVQDQLKWGLLGV
eukprot:g9365.t1